MDGAKTKAEWEAKRPKLKEQFLDMLGLWPLPEKTPLKATVTGTLERGDVIIEKLHYQSKPGLYVTGNLYRPKATPEGKKLPAILYVCGHSDQRPRREQDRVPGPRPVVRLERLRLPDRRHAATRRGRGQAPRHVQPRPVLVAGPRLHARRRRVLERHPRHRLPALAAGRRPGAHRRDRHLRRRGDARSGSPRPTTG